MQDWVKKGLLSFSINCKVDQLVCVYIIYLQIAFPKCYKCFINVKNFIVFFKNTISKLYYSQKLYHLKRVISYPEIQSFKKGQVKTHWSDSRAIIHASTQFTMVKSGPACFFLKGCISGCIYICHLMRWGKKHCYQK